MSKLHINNVRPVGFYVWRGGVRMRNLFVLYDTEWCSTMCFPQDYCTVRLLRRDES